MRIILYTGKGGVGKTSVAAATAVMAAKQGKKVIIMSTDQAHSLGDSFGVKLENEPKEIMENLAAFEIDAIIEGEKSWGKIKNYLKQILTVQAQGGIETEELLVFPGIEELFSLFKMVEIYEQNQYDLLVVDCAPTGETLSLLKFPESFGQLIRKVLPMERTLTKVAGPAVEKLTKIPMPKSDVYDEIESLDERLVKLQSILQNQDITSLRIVTTPERIVIKEAKRNFTCLHLYGYNVDAIVVNKVYPQQAMNGYFNHFVSLQEEGMKDIHSSFGSIPIFQLPLFQKELREENTLEEAGKQLFQTKDPTVVLFKDQVFRLEKQKEGYVLSLNIPFAQKEEMDMSQKGDELMIQIKNEKRCFTLPSILLGKEVQGASFEDGWLNIQFAS